MSQRLKIEVRGMVQGVGFRPFVYKLAHRFGLTGNVRNSESGVVIDVQGADDSVMAFLEALTAEAPPLARVLKITTAALPLQ